MPLQQQAYRFSFSPREEPSNHATCNVRRYSTRAQRTPSEVRSLSELITSRERKCIRDRQTQRNDYCPSASSSSLIHALSAALAHADPSKPVIQEEK